MLGAVQFVVAMAVVQTRYAGYSLRSNTISDLGGAHSPWAIGFDVSVAVLGILILVGALLVRNAFDPARGRSWGLFLVVLAGVGSLGVGLFPETSSALGGLAHGLFAGVALVGGGLGLVVPSNSMRRSDRWSLSRPYTLVSGTVTLVAPVLYTLGFTPFIGAGGMERLVVAPLLLWAMVVGLHLARLPRYAPRFAAPSPA